MRLGCERGIANPPPIVPPESYRTNRIGGIWEGQQARIFGRQPAFGAPAQN
jgi:hypothetical protein